MPGTCSSSHSNAFCSAGELECWLISRSATACPTNQALGPNQSAFSRQCLGSEAVCPSSSKVNSGLPGFQESGIKNLMTRDASIGPDVSTTQIA